MPEPRNQWVDVVAKLIELTQTGKLKWKVSDFEPTGADSPAYTARYKEQRLRLQKRRVRDDQWSEYRDAHVLEFIGVGDASLWKFPTEIDSLADLFEAVQFQTAGVKGFIDDILSNGSE